MGWQYFDYFDENQNVVFILSFLTQFSAFSQTFYVKICDFSHPMSQNAQFFSVLQLNKEGYKFLPFCVGVIHILFFSSSKRCATERTICLLSIINFTSSLDAHLAFTVSLLSSTILLMLTSFLTR